VVFQGGFFCLGRSFPFSSLIGFFLHSVRPLLRTVQQPPPQKKKMFLKSDLLDHWRILYHTHTSRLLRLSSLGLGSLLNHLAEHCVVYWANWIPQYQNQTMLSSINWLLRGYMYRTKHRNGICQITLFSNVSLASPAYCTRQGKTTLSRRIMVPA